jgi:hypothetical protein
MRPASNATWRRVGVTEIEGTMAVTVRPRIGDILIVKWHRSSVDGHWHDT